MGRAWREVRRFRPSLKRRAVVWQRAEHRGLLSAQRALRRASPLRGSAKCRPSAEHERPCWDLRGRGRDLGRRAGGILVEPAGLARRAATSRRRSPCQPAGAAVSGAALWQVPSLQRGVGAGPGGHAPRNLKWRLWDSQGAGASMDVDMRPTVPGCPLERQSKCALLSIAQRLLRPDVTWASRIVRTFTAVPESFDTGGICLSRSPRHPRATEHTSDRRSSHQRPGPCGPGTACLVRSLKPWQPARRSLIGTRSVVSQRLPALLQQL